MRRTGDICHRFLKGEEEAVFEWWPSEKGSVWQGQPAGLSQRGAGSLGKGGCLWVQWWEALVDYKVFKKCDGV